MALGSLARRGLADLGQDDDDDPDLFEEIFGDASQRLPPGARVRVPFGRRMVEGRVVRYDASGPESPFYVVDIGRYASERVPAHEVRPAADAR
mgnify:FL=1